MQPLKYKAVNWQDGMKISKDHFIHQENYFVDSIRDSAAAGLNRFNYGLLPAGTSGKSLDVKISVDPVKLIRATLQRCLALTSSGERIEIQDGKLTSDYDFGDSKENTFYVTLTVNLFDRNPSGKPLNGEEPARPPFSEPTYLLGIHPESQVRLNNSVFIIGKLEVRDGRLQVVENFIPASTAVSNHPLLSEKYFQLGNQMGETANLNLSIVQKIHAKSQATSLVKSFLTISEKISDFLASNLAYFTGIVSEMPPVYMIETFTRFAYVIRFTLERMTPKDKEELLTYFSEWTEMPVPMINERITSMIRTEYRHDDIQLSLTKAEEFMTAIYTIFSKLNALDFIGKKKGGGAFVTELSADQIVQEVKPLEQKKGWSFLAE